MRPFKRFTAWSIAFVLSITWTRIAFADLWGAVVGGAVGFAGGGPIGLVTGVVAGDYLTTPSEDVTAQQGWALSSGAILGGIAYGPAGVAAGLLVGDYATRADPLPPPAPQVIRVFIPQAPATPDFLVASNATPYTTTPTTPIDFAALERAQAAATRSAILQLMPMIRRQVFQSARNGARAGVVDAFRAQQLQRENAAVNQLAAQMRSTLLRAVTTDRPESRVVWMLEPSQGLAIASSAESRTGVTALLKPAATTDSNAQRCWSYCGGFRLAESAADRVPLRDLTPAFDATVLHAVGGNLISCHEVLRVRCETLDIASHPGSAGTLTVAPEDSAHRRLLFVSARQMLGPQGQLRLRLQVPRPNEVNPE